MVHILIIGILMHLCLSGFDLHSDSDVTRISSNSLRSWFFISLPESIACLTSLARLIVDSSAYADPYSWWCRQLKIPFYLLVNSKQLTCMTESIGHLTCLTHLEIGNNQLNRLSDSIFNLDSLAEFYISLNQLTHLPETLGNLTSLSELHIYNNLLTHIPESIGKMVSVVVELHVRNNHLSYLPDSIRNMESLTVLNVTLNPITLTQDNKDEVLRRFGRAGLVISC